MRRNIATIWAAFALTAFLSITAQGAVIDIGTSNGGSEPNFGLDTDPATLNELTEVMGQTFVTPADPILTSFSFWLNVDAGVTLNFHARLYAWNGTTATGSALFSSAQRSLTNPPTGFTKFDFTPGVTLTPGSTYVALLEAAAGSTAGSGSDVARVETGTGPDIGTGQFVSFNYGGPGAANVLTTFVGSQWNLTRSNLDLRFVANFAPQQTNPPNNPVPEPSTLAMFGLMGVGLICRSVRRRLAK